MKIHHLVAAALLAAITALPATASVTVNIGHPGFYGRIDIGGFPPPPLLFPQPMLINPMPYERPPVYLRVPHGHAKDWRRYCHRYGACGENVYFVRDGWYRNEYAPRYRERHHHRDRDRHDYYDDRRGRHEYRHERRHDDDHGRGRGRGRGHDD